MENITGNDGVKKTEVYKTSLCTVLRRGLSRCCCIRQKAEQLLQRQMLYSTNQAVLIVRRTVNGCSLLSKHQFYSYLPPSLSVRHRVKRRMTDPMKQ